MPAQAQQQAPLLVGEVADPQGSAVAGVMVALRNGADNTPLAQSRTQQDGRFALPLPDTLPDSLTLHLERPHFEPETRPLETAVVNRLQAQQTVVLPVITLPRHITVAFWIAAVVFVGMLVGIALSELHNTLIALAATTLIFAVSYLGEPLHERLFIFDFDTAL